MKTAIIFLFSMCWSLFAFSQRYSFEGGEIRGNRFILRFEIEHGNVTYDQQFTVKLKRLSRKVKTLPDGVTIDEDNNLIYQGQMLAGGDSIGLLWGIALTNRRAIPRTGERVVHTCVSAPCACNGFAKDEAGELLGCDCAGGESPCGELSLCNHAIQSGGIR